MEIFEIIYIIFIPCCAIIIYLIPSILTYRLFKKIKGKSGTHRKVGLSIFILTTVITIGFPILAVSALIWGDEDELGNGYYVLTDFDAMDLGSSFGSIIYKGNKEFSYDKMIVYSGVKKYNYNDDFIIVYQNVDEKLIKKNLIDYGGKVINAFKQGHSEYRISDFYGEDIKNIFYSAHLKPSKDKKEAKFLVDSIINNNIFFKKMYDLKKCYYIIDKTKDSLYGPLSKEEFKIKKDSLNIDLECNISTEDIL